MSQFSNFAPFGQFEFSDEPEFLPERMYSAQLSALGPAFAGPNDEAETYADVMCFSAASEEITAAGAQDDPAQCSYLINELMRDYNVPIIPGATLDDNRVELAFRAAASVGSFNSAVVAGLTTILGSLLIHWRPMNEGSPSPDEVAPSTTYPVHSPPVNAAIKVVSIADTIFPGTRTVSYSRIVDDGNGIIEGDEVVVDAGLRGLAEVVTANNCTASSFTATFTKTHDPGSYAHVGPYCWWSCNARHSMVIVDDSALENAYLINRVHEFMRKTMPSTSTWIICKESSAGFVGPFTVGDTVGQTPIGESAGFDAILTVIP